MGANLSRVSELPGFSGGNDPLPDLQLTPPHETTDGLDSTSKKTLSTVNPPTGTKDAGNLAKPPGTVPLRAARSPVRRATPNDVSLPRGVKVPPIDAAKAVAHAAPGEAAAGVQDSSTGYAGTRHIHYAMFETPSQDALEPMLDARRRFLTTKASSSMSTPRTSTPGCRPLN